MCGIVGFTGEEDRRLVSKKLKIIEHRGRDEFVVRHDKGLNLGMNRLAINDLTKGLFPMRYKHYVMIFNGEIYNYSELKNNLFQKGIKLKTRNDGEVILPLLDLYKEKAFKLLEGMFAIAIFDTRKKKLILIRDKFGEKPLYYFYKNGYFSFASELKALIFDKKVNFKINLNSLNEYLQQGFAFGNKSFVKGVKKLNPGCFLEYDLKSQKIKKESYWQLRIQSGFEKIPEFILIDELELKLKEAIRKRLLSDVEIGCFLSGGIDSSMIALYAKEFLGKLKTFSISFEGNKREDESEYSRKVSTWLDTDHKEIRCNGKSVKPIVENIGKYIDEPICDTAVLPTFLLAKEARKKVKVVLSGGGADEIFAGYHRYWQELLAIKIRGLLGENGGKILSKFTRGRFNKIFTSVNDHYSTQGIWNYDELNNLVNFNCKKLLFPFLKKYIKDNLLLGMQLTDLSGYLPEQLLMKVDKMTMSNNLESRAPYLDTDLVGWALNLPEELKISNRHGKYLLKKLGERYFSKSFTWRPKHGFYVPINNWLRKELKKEALDSVEKAGGMEIFKSKYYEKIVKKHMSREGDYGDKIWSMIVLSKWMKEYNIDV